MLARKEANAKSFTDFKGKKFNVGNPGSGTRASLEELIAAMGWKLARLRARLRAQGRRARPRAVRRQDRRLLLRRRPPLGQHPGPDHVLRREAACRSPGRRSTSWSKEKPYYAKATIPAGPLPEQPAGDAKTYGVLATLVSLVARSRPTRVYAVVKAVFDNFEEFKKLHPALANLEAEDMVKNGLSAPLHEGAARYYKEKGWIK